MRARNTRDPGGSSQGHLSREDRELVASVHRGLVRWHRMNSFERIVECRDPKPCHMCQTIEELFQILQTGKRVRRYPQPGEEQSQ